MWTLLVYTDMLVGVSGQFYSLERKNTHLSYNSQALKMTQAASNSIGQQHTGQLKIRQRRMHKSKSVTVHAIGLHTIHVEEE